MYQWRWAGGKLLLQEQWGRPDRILYECAFGPDGVHVRTSVEPVRGTVTCQHGFLSGEYDRCEMMDGERFREWFRSLTGSEW